MCQLHDSIFAAVCAMHWFTLPSLTHLAQGPPSGGKLAKYRTRRHQGMARGGDPCRGWKSAAEHWSAEASKARNKDKTS